MPELTISLTEEQLLDLEAAAGLRGETVEGFALRVVSDEAQELVRGPWRIYEQVLDDRFDDLLRRLR